MGPTIGFKQISTKLWRCKLDASLELGYGLQIPGNRFIRLRSTYLVALVVSDFQCVQTTAKPILSKSINVSVCSRPNAIQQLDFAVSVAVKSLEFFEAHFGVEYPLPKSGKQQQFSPNRSQDI